MRVVSLLPSATETLCLLGGSRDLVGRSHECDFPASIADRTVLTQARTAFTTSADVDRQVRSALGKAEALYRLDTEALRSLRPDLILTQDLCSVCSIDLNTVRTVAQTLDPEPRIVSLNPESVEGVLDDVLTIGEAIGRADEADRALVALRERFYRAADFVNAYTDGPVVALLEWTDPPFIGGHWSAQLVERAGARHPLNETVPLENAGAGAGAHMAHRVAGPSVRITPEQLIESRPDALVIAPCGLDLETARRETLALTGSAWWAELPAARGGRVAVVDGNQMFNRPGPRIVDAFEFLVGWLWDLPDLIPEDFPWAPLD